MTAAEGEEPRPATYRERLRADSEDRRRKRREANAAKLAKRERARIDALRVNKRAAAVELAVVSKPAARHDGDGWSLTVWPDGSATVDLDAGELDSIGLTVAVVDSESLPIALPVAPGMTAADVWHGRALPAGDAGVIAASMATEARQLLAEGEMPAARSRQPIGVFAVEVGAVLARRLRVAAWAELGLMHLDDIEARRAREDEELTALLDAALPAPGRPSRMGTMNPHSASPAHQPQETTA